MRRKEGRREIGYEPHRAYHPIHSHILDSSISLLYFSFSHLRPWGSQICPGQIGQVSQHQRLRLQRRRRHLIGPNVTHDRQTHGRSADGRTTSPRSRAMPPRRMGLPACLPVRQGFPIPTPRYCGEDIARAAQKRPHIIYGASKVSRNPFSNNGQTGAPLLGRAYST